MIQTPPWLFRLVRLTRREYFADFWITPPLTVALAARSLVDGSGRSWMLLFLAGWFFWTLYEYVAHRAAHHVPWLADLHWLHHRNQKDYIALHPLVTLSMYLAIWLTFGFSHAAFAVGFSVGYIVYAGLHTAFHYGQVRAGDWLWPLKRHHVAHHRFHDRCFGVSTTLWDWIFRTI
ncbi:MAG: sterol desaturase family protein [Bradyrhizobium sp.]|nr:sterol desaturase family protein [Bradyrhizobium sp.]